MIVVKPRLEELKRVARKVFLGAVVVYPTDTVYGIGCDPYNEGAVRRIMELKGREESKALPILCSSFEVAKKLVYLGEESFKLAKNFWPGPLTLIEKLKDYKISKLARLNLDKIGVRVPDNPLTLKFIELCGGKLIGTSANKSGLKAPKNPEEVFEFLGKDFDFLIDGGECKYGKASTVIDFTFKPFKIVREGPLSLKEVFKVLNEP
ncbi:MAG: L-threonylcarbamoyladenylate synthase [Nitrososphaerales archaeon]